MTIRVCQLIGQYNSGGINRVAESIHSNLGNEFSSTLLARGDSFSHKSTIRSWSRFPAVLRDFDIIHCHDVYSLPGLIKLKSLYPEIKIVYTHHGIVPLKYQDKRNFPGWLFAKFCAKQSIPKVDLAIGISIDSCNDLEKYKPRNSKLIPNGIDLDIFKEGCDVSYLENRYSGYPILLYVGFIDKHKGTEFLVKAMPTILRQFPKAKLLLVGEGRVRDALWVKSLKQGTGNKIIFLGEVSNSLLPMYYNFADIFVDPSYWHSFGIGIVEALACGKPFIARPDYAMFYHLEEAIPVGLPLEDDNYYTLVKRINSLLSRKAVGKANAKEIARSYASEFDIRKVVKMHEKAYKELC